MATPKESDDRALPTNPFPVYAVSSLREIASDILANTVYTDGVRAIAQAVLAYVGSAGTYPHSGLAVPVRGDYGTGKTHLLLFAQAKLREAWPGGDAGITLLSVPTTEAAFPEWYLNVVAPAIARLDLGDIFARVLAAAACEVADLVPLTAGAAQRMRNDPLEVYPILRDEQVSRTDVERVLTRFVAEIAPRASDDLRSVLKALVWPVKQELATRWFLDAPECVYVLEALAARLPQLWRVRPDGARPRSPAKAAGGRQPIRQHLRGEGRGASA